MQYVIVGFFIFIFAFVLQLPAEITPVGEPYRLVIMLEMHPHFYLGFMQESLFYLVLPPAFGLVFIIIGHVKERKDFLKWQVAVGGGIILFWGLFAIQSVYDAYCDAMGWILRYDIPIGNLLLPIYATIMISKIILLLAGVLSIYSYMRAVLIRYLLGNELNQTLGSNTLNIYTID